MRFAGLSPDERARLDAIGRVWNDDLGASRKVVLDVYRDHHQEKAANDGIVVHRDLAYGADPAHRLDVFESSSRCASGRGRPVVVFVHGGAFTRGSKSADGLIYDNVLRWFSRQGLVGVNVEYRLAPGAQYPEGARDVAAAIDWIAANIERFGGNPRAILLVGHSAGGCHVAGYLHDPNVGRLPSPDIRGAVLISARLRADSLPTNPNANNVRQYFGDDEAAYDALSPVIHAGTSALPVMVAVAEFENRYIDAYGAEFVQRHAMRTGKAPRFVQLSRHNHTSIVAHFDTHEEELGHEIMRFAIDECGLFPCGLSCQKRK
ncbi:alpha/beta hydrolase [Aminobacter sp. NyZ550]|uniref:alpha/beta hydrolase n=1 Tax=Aminobacter sp. NyZ550 TaxID=2979870 RepID=UPI0021D5E1E7|nr:alpha/beta hydrolase [Aminobacter sp. NyZ550]WAX96271.1 alpha/beta hydrolase [Aminobacter sp. NyZ550]